ncbi:MULTISPECIES: hypothetical protein [Nostocales]|uniref:Uncharacterized protein n=3 Tax=Nostocales TaxID=1161 RepID=A0A0C1N343_9CYAN|nr:hypothetical protein [Tolypothrix bouteillei]KAF3889761.1 hypothetical protein DA73_0400033070 [Tolypothrix bouteillei VB521301]
MNSTKKVFSYSLLSLLLFNNILTFHQKAIGSQSITDKPNLEKSLLEEQNRIAQGQKRICLRSFCIDKSSFTETFLAKQIRVLVEQNAPVTANSNNLYPLVSSLPGGSFRPNILDLEGASPKQILPAGDYVIPVKVYSLQRVASSPNGHRYLLGRYGGSRKEVLAALNRSAASSDVSQKDLQNLSWAVQAGASYKDMPAEMQALVNKLIPQYRSALKPGWWEEIEQLWNQSSQALHLHSLQEFLTRNLGDTGRSLFAMKQVRDRLVAKGGNWRNLADLFLINDGTAGAGNVLETPWSQVGEGVYARFVTEGNANDTGLLQLRIMDGKVAQKGMTNGNKGIPLLPIIARAMTVYELYQIITTLVALPEGNKNIQPLTMSPDLFSVTKDLVEIGIKFCERRSAPRGRLLKAMNILCSIAGETPRITKLKVKEFHH